jgi:pyocin large subunit-like protein
MQQGLWIGVGLGIGGGRSITVGLMGNVVLWTAGNETWTAGNVVCTHPSQAGRTTGTTTPPNTCTPPNRMVGIVSYTDPSPTFVHWAILTSHP